MSTRAKITFASSCVLTAATIFYVHYQQTEERLQMSANVMAEVEQEKQQRLEANRKELERQQALTRSLQKQQ
ncbi:hypothetical protein MIR68_009560 [Amoeboaphelidium protococcarum]|nr:hypothetical protein MIR68_009560 [Amoeboaphelidium protococcarum]